MGDVLRHLVHVIKYIELTVLGPIVGFVSPEALNREWVAVLNPLLYGDDKTVNFDDICNNILKAF